MAAAMRCTLVLSHAGALRISRRNAKGGNTSFVIPKKSRTSGEMSSGGSGMHMPMDATTYATARSHVVRWVVSQDNRVVAKCAPMQNGVSREKVHM